MKRKPGRPPGRKSESKPLYIRLSPEERALVEVANYSSVSVNKFWKARILMVAKALVRGGQG